jgi:hypothetical protein
MKLIAVAIVLSTLVGCATGVTVGDRSARGPVTGAAGGANSVGASAQLERCETPIGTLAVVEDTQQDWYQLLTTQYQLPSTVPLLRLMIQQSNCFVVVDRGRGLDAMQTERDLRDSGELRAGSNYGGGQMVAADYTLTPSIQFAQQTGGGAVGALVGMVSPIGGLIAGGRRKIEAATTLIMVDGRSGVQVAIAEGVASKKDFSFGAIGGGSGGGLGVGAWQSTPHGKVIAGAFMDSFNQLVQATRSYSAQRTQNALGTGGALTVQGSTPAPAPVAAAAPAMSWNQVQSKLKSLGLYAGAIDGQVGTGTLSALRQFQRIRGLPESGALDAATLAALR